MKYLPVPGVPRPVSRLVLGSMIFSLDKMDLVRRLLDAYVERGGNCLDTANTYYYGQSEQAIGLWLRERKMAGEVLILDKGAHPKGGSGPRVNPAAIVADLEESLGRLGVDAIDLYLLHRDDPSVPVGSLVECLNEQHRLGRIRSFGGSNWSVARLEEANGYAAARGLVGFVASSPHLSLAVALEPRWPGCLAVSAADLDWYRRRQFPLFAWSAQAGGFFSGRFSPKHKDDPDLMRVYDCELNWERLRRAQELARRKGVSANQIALAYVLHQPFPTFALVGPVTVEELCSSMEAASIELSPEEVRWLEADSPS